MITASDLCAALPTLPEDPAHILAGIVAAIETSAPIRGLFVHGSYTRGTQVFDSDVDLIAILDTPEGIRAVVEELPARVEAVAPILASAYTERFPWFRRLWTFYFDVDPLFAVDLGLLAVEELRDFFVEPDAVIFCDVDGAVAGRRRQCYRERIEARARLQAEIRFDVFHAVVKLEQAVRKGYLWNAFEYVNILRRALFRILRGAADPPDYVHVGRAERDLERRLPWVARAEWSDTIPAYRSEAIVDAALAIVERIETASRSQQSLAEGGLLDRAIARLSRLHRRDAT